PVRSGWPGGGRRYAAPPVRPGPWCWRGCGSGSPTIWTPWGRSRPATPGRAKPSPAVGGTRPRRPWSATPWMPCWAYPCGCPTPPERPGSLTDDNTDGGTDGDIDGDDADRGAGGAHRGQSAAVALLRAARAADARAYPRRLPDLRRGVGGDRTPDPGPVGRRPDHAGHSSDSAVCRGRRTQT